MINKLSQELVEGTPASAYPPANVDALNQINQASGLPTWNGSPWPSGAVPGATSALTFYNAIRVNEVSTQALKLTGGVISALNGINGSDSKNAIIGVRDARGTSGVGTAGNVNTTICAVAHSSSVQANSEWAITAVADNNSTHGGCGTVGVYGQSNSLASTVTGEAGGYGGVWGGCFEACDMTYGAQTNRAIIGAELDAWVSGHQPFAKGALIVCNDSKAVRGVGVSADKRAGHGILILGDNGAKWKIGIEVQQYCEEGLLIFPGSTYSFTGVDPAQAIRIQGPHTDSLINIRFASAGTGIKIKESVTLATNLAVDIGASHFYGVDGQKVLGKRKPKWGYANAANIANDNAGGNAFYRFDPNMDFKYLGESLAAGADLATLSFHVGLMYKIWGAFVTDFRPEWGHGAIGS